MSNESFAKVHALVPLLICFCAPFYGNTAFFGDRYYVELFPGSLKIFPTTQFGLMNLVAVFLTLLISLRLIVLNIFAVGYRFWDFLFVAFAGMILIRVSSFGRESLVLLQNYLTVILLLLLAAKLRFNFDIFSRWHTWAYGLFSFSYLFNCALPFLFSGLGVSTFDRSVEYTSRFKAWYEFPSAVGFLSFIAFAWSLNRVLSRVKWRSCLFEIFILVFAFFFMYQSTHRTAFLALFSFGLLGFLFSLKKKQKRSIGIFFLVVVFSVASQFVGKIGDKNNWEPAFIGNDNPGIEGPGIFNYSGRRALYTTMFGLGFDKPIFGHGTGAISREMSANHPGLTVAFGSEPHSEILRTFYDWGILGLLLLLAIGVTVFWQSSTAAEISMFAGLVGFMLTENAFLHPLWFYLPLFFATFYLSHEQRTS